MGRILVAESSQPIPKEQDGLSEKEGDQLSAAPGRLHSVPRLATAGQKLLHRAERKVSPPAGGQALMYGSIDDHAVRGSSEVCQTATQAYWGPFCTSLSALSRTGRLQLASI